MLLFSVVLDRRTDQNAETGYFEMIFKQIIPKTPAYMGLNLSLKGQRITPKCPQKREKSPNKSLHSIYTLARLSSSSNRMKPRNTDANGPTIMDFMQCLNFKTRLDREKDQLKKKIRSSTLYKKPNFSYSIYNPLNGNVANNKISCISKNIKINEFKDDALKKIKSPFATGDENDESLITEEKTNFDILCIGNKYVDPTPNLTTVKTLTVAIAEVNYINSNNTKINDLKPIEVDFERATTSILQSNLSPSAQLHLRKQPMTVVQESMKKSKTAKSNCHLKDDSDKSGGLDNSTATVPDPTKRKTTTKLFKKSSNSHFFAVGLRMRSKYTDAIITEIENDLPTLTTLNENTVKKLPSTDSAAKSSKKSGLPRKLYKKSTHNKKSDIKVRSSKTAKGVTKKIKTEV